MNLLERYEEEYRLVEQLIADEMKRMDAALEYYKGLIEKAKGGQTLDLILDTARMNIEQLISEFGRHHQRLIRLQGLMAVERLRTTS